jgi:hypothetical protein
MPIIPIRKTKPEPIPSPATVTKTVDANQKSIDALPLNSGHWKVEGTAGLYVRARATSKSFMLQRRIRGELVKVMLGQVSLKIAKERAAREWGTVQPSEPGAKSLTLGAAIEEYIQARTAAGKLAPKTARMARYNAEHYLSAWTKRTIKDLGNSRLEMRSLQQQLTKKHKAATSNQVIRLLSAVYNWCRKVDIHLPDPRTRWWWRKFIRSQRAILHIRRMH